eukprot:jgi/Phyca11/535905/estExt2_fgenesh1_pg.C_PHYCAscaffold_430056
MAEETCCGCVAVDADNEYDMGFHIGSIFIIFAVSAAGTMIPIISQGIPQCKANSIIMETISAFAYGVVIATGLIHMVNEDGHGHTHGEAVVQEAVITPEGDMTPRPADHPYHEKSLDQAAHDSKIRRKIATLIFEAGVIFHSVIIGLDLGVTTGSEFKTLLAALCFHQFFEGVAIGTSALSSLETKGKLFMVNFAFAITTPVGQVIGIAIRSTYSDSSTTALWVQGTLDCVAGGILLYTGLVELLTYNMTTNGQFLSRPTAQRFTLYISLWLGAGLMALIGKWA